MDGILGDLGLALRRLREAPQLTIIVVLTLALVIGAGVLLRSFRALAAVDPGFRPSEVLKAEYQLPDTRYPLDYSRWPNLPEINSSHGELLRRVPRRSR
jgi:hypothetical protein